MAPHQEKMVDGIEGQFFLVPAPLDDERAPGRLEVCTKTRYRLPWHLNDMIPPPKRPDTRCASMQKLGKRLHQYIVLTGIPEICSPARSLRYPIP